MVTTIDTPRDEAALAERSDAPTAALESVGGDPLARLDRRTQRRLRPVDGVAPGRYLAMGSDPGAPVMALTEDVTHIGRGLHCELRIEDHHVSRLHASITFDGSATHLLDSRSLNGTWVNGERVAYTVLRRGDIIEIGALTFRYLEI